LIVRAARLNEMLDAKSDLNAPSLGDKDGQLRTLVDRAARIARGMSNRVHPEHANGSFLHPEHANGSFWESHIGREPDDRGNEDRAGHALSTFFDAEDHALIVGFARQRQIPLPQETQRPDSYAAVQQLDRFEQRNVRRWLQQYRLTRLAFGAIHHRNKEVIEMLTGDIDDAARRRIRQLAEDVADDLGRADVQVDLRSKAKELITELAQRLEEVGFDGLVESAMGGAMPSSLVGITNVVPSTSSSACCPIVLALVRGRTGRCGWGKTLAALRTHLIRCDRVTKVVILVTDQWDSASFDDEYAEDFRGFASRGLQWVTLLGGRSSHGFARLHLDL
jgi:hypothetical protein